MPILLLIIVFLCGGAVFFEASRPIEVKSAVYTLEGARLTLNRRALLNLVDRYELRHLQFTENIYLNTQNDTEREVVDYIRGRPLLCGARPCISSNPIAKDLAEVSAKLTKARLTTSATSDALKSTELKLASTESAFEQAECPAKLSAQPPQRHPMACDPGTERTTSEGLCLVATLGPDACAKYAGDEVFSQIAASEACSTAAAALLNETRTGSEREADAMLGLISHASSAVLNSAKEGNIFALLFTPYAAAVKIVEMQRKVESFNGCVPKAIQRCSTAYQNWRAELVTFEEQFGPALARCAKIDATLTTLKSEVMSGRKYQAELLVAIEGYEKATAELRSKELTVIF